MSASHPFIARHLVAIHLAAWSIFIGLIVVDGYFDLPHPLSVPFSAYVVLVGVPFIIAVTFRRLAPDISLPESLRRFIRFSPFGLGGLWLICVAILIAGIVGGIQVRSILH